MQVHPLHIQAESISVPTTSSTPMNQVEMLSIESSTLPRLQCDVALQHMADRPQLGHMVARTPHCRLPDLWGPSQVPGVSRPGSRTSRRHRRPATSTSTFKAINPDPSSPSTTSPGPSVHGRAGGRTYPGQSALADVVVLSTREAEETKRRLAEEVLRKLLSFDPADDDWSVARENLRVILFSIFWSHF